MSNATQQPKPKSNDTLSALRQARHHILRQEPKRAVGVIEQQIRRLESGK